MTKNNFNTTLQKAEVDPNFQNEWQPPVQITKDGAIVIHRDGYVKEYDDVAFNTVAQPGGSLVHLAVVFDCSEVTVKAWIQKHPSFRDAIIKGHNVGNTMFRQKMMEHAFEPSSQVNNGLIKMIALNVYGITDAEAMNVYINTDGTEGIDNSESAKIYKNFMERDDVIDVEFEEE